jgi:hypothetical protein
MGGVRRVGALEIVSVSVIDLDGKYRLAASERVNDIRSIHVRVVRRDAHKERYDLLEVHAVAASM